MLCICLILRLRFGRSRLPNLNPKALTVRAVALPKQTRTPIDYMFIRVHWLKGSGSLTLAVLQLLLVENRALS
jgi:hypothetical protein